MREGTKGLRRKSGLGQKFKALTFYFVAIFTAFMATVEKIITNALGDHDHRSALNGRTSREMWSPAW